jgi:hypothetical protein
MTKGGVRRALKLKIIDSITALRPDTIMFMHSESINITSESFSF